MRGLERFVSLGLADADARVDNALAPRSYEGVDEYLRSSRIVRMVDAVTRRLRAGALSSRSGAILRSWTAQWRRQGWPAKYESIAAVLLAAVTIHVLLTLANGPRPGWYWAIVPGLAAMLAVVLLAGTRARSSS